MFGNEDAAPLVGAQRRVAQGDRVDDACVLLHGDPVAEAHGLREREEDAGAEVAERRREREAGDDGEHRARGEEGARDLLRRWKCGQDAPGADEPDERDDDAEEEAERRAATGGDCRIPLGQAGSRSDRRHSGARSELRTARPPRRGRRRAPLRGGCPRRGVRREMRCACLAYSPARTLALAAAYSSSVRRALPVQVREPAEASCRHRSAPEALPHSARRVRSASRPTSRTSAHAHRRRPSDRPCPETRAASASV